MKKIKEYAIPFLVLTGAAFIGNLVYHDLYVPIKKVKVLKKQSVTDSKSPVTKTTEEKK